MGLEKFSDDPDKYIDVPQGLTQTSDLSGKEVMLLLSQTLSGSEKWLVLDAIQQYFLANAD